MASKQGSKSKRLGAIKSKAANSHSSSTTSSSKQFLETSIDGQSSPASSSALSKPQYFYSENVPLNGESSKENVTVTVRFRPLRSAIHLPFSFLHSFLLPLLSSLMGFVHFMVVDVVLGKFVKERRLLGMLMEKLLSEMNTIRPSHMHMVNLIY